MLQVGMEVYVSEWLDKIAVGIPGFLELFYADPSTCSSWGPTYLIII